jgi:hypothetical protein
MMTKRQIKMLYELLETVEGFLSEAERGDDMTEKAKVLRPIVQGFMELLGEEEAGGFEHSNC